MKKKLFFKFFVFAVIGALVTMTSCKDYDDDISRLDKELGDAKTELTGSIASQLAALKTEMNSAVDAKVKVVADDLAAANTKLNSLQTTLTALENAAATKAELDAVEAQIDATKAEILGMVVKLEAFNTFKTENGIELAALSGRITALEAGSATKAELAAAKKALEDKIELLSDEIAEDYATKKELTDAIEALELIDAALAGRITTLEENSATKAELAALEAEIAGELLALQSQLDDLGIEINRLDQAIADLIEKHDEDVQDLIGRIGDLRAELDPRITTIETLLEIADGKSGALDKIAKDLADHLEKINANAEAIALLREDMEDGFADQLLLIQANEDAIEAVAEDLALKYEELVGVDEDLQKQITNNYNELDERVTINKDAIEALEGRVDAIEEELEEIWTEIGELEGRLNLRINSVFKLVTSRLTAITLATNAYVEGIEAIKFTSLNYGCMEDGDNKLVVTDDKKLVTSIGAPAVANYKFNPRTFNLDNADYSYADRVAEVISTRATGSSLVAIEEVKNATDGTVEFTLRRLNAHKTQPTGNKENFIQLEATLTGDAVAEGEEGVVIAAKQELVYDEIIKPADISIGDNGVNNKCGNGFIPYAYTFDKAQEMTPVYKMEYNKVFNLREKVRVCFGLTEREMEDFNLDLRFDMPDGKYYIDSDDTETEQQKYFELVDGDAGLFKATGFNKEALGRTPIFRVELVTEDGCVIRRAFVKVEVIVAKSDDLVVGITEDLVFKCADTETTYEITEEFIRENVYRKIAATTGEVSMSHEEFWNTYEWQSQTSPEVVITKTPNAISQHTMPDPTIVSGTTSQGTATKKIVWTFTHSKLGSLGTGGATFVATVTVKNKLVNSAYPEKVTFKFTVNAKLPAMTPEFTGNERDPYWSTDADANPIAFMSNVAYPQTVTSPASDAQFKTYLKDAYSSYKLNLPESTCVSALKYKIVNTYSNGVKDNSKLGGVQLGVDGDGDYITLVKGNTAVENALNSPLGLKADIEIYVTINGQDIPVHMFPVHFIRPLNINATDAEVTDGETGGSTASFLWSGLLTDWRNKPVYHGSFNWEQTCSEGWEYLPEATAVHVPGYYEMTQKASLNVETDEVSFTTGSATTMYKGTEVWRVSKETQRWYPTGPGNNGNWMNIQNSPANTNHTLVSDSYLTEADAQADLYAQSSALKVANESLTWSQYSTGSGYNKVYYRERTTVTRASGPDFETETVGSGQTISYTYVKSIDYVPAQYTWVPGYTDYQYLPWSPKPTTNGTPSERVNNWVWQETCHDYVVTDFGQYWAFYGPISGFTVHVDRATTSLSDGKVPSGVTLTATANGIKYVNIGAAVTSDYVITIPVSINYGWGTVETNFYVTVKKSI